MSPIQKLIIPLGVFIFLIAGIGMDDIDVSLLRSFVAVAETGRMTTAARVVNRSQGAVRLVNR